MGTTGAHLECGDSSEQRSAITPSVSTVGTPAGRVSSICTTRVPVWRTTVDAHQIIGRSSTSKSDAVGAAMQDTPRRKYAHVINAVVVTIVLGCAALGLGTVLQGTAQIVAVGLVGVLWVGLGFWRIPLWQAEQATLAQRSEDVTETKTFFEFENSARDTLGKALSGMFLVVGLAVTWQQVHDGRIEQRQAAEQAAADRGLTERGQIGDRFTAAVDQLSDTSVRVRLGGIYA